MKKEVVWNLLITIGVNVQCFISTTQLSKCSFDTQSKFTANAWRKYKNVNEKNVNKCKWDVYNPDIPSELSRLYNLHPWY